jgi:hypothetical protein
MVDGRLVIVREEEDNDSVLFESRVGNMGQRYTTALQPKLMQIDPRQVGLILARRGDKNPHVRGTHGRLVVVRVDKLSDSAVGHHLAPRPVSLLNADADYSAIS